MQIFLMGRLQDKPFYKHSAVKEVLEVVLFTWAKNNKEISYKQGMNELVAVLLYVCFKESFDPRWDPELGDHEKQ